ncbi:MAG TPA: hypothetical protein VGA67_06150 [Candidatus Dojkabacteria bacterium]|jgi:hypothetical protein
MKFRYLIILALILCILQYILFPTKYLTYIEFIIIFAWLISYYRDIGLAFIFMIVGSFFLELFTFRQIGIYTLTFSLGMLGAYFLKNYLNLYSDDERFRISFLGFILNMILYSTILLATRENLNLVVLCFNLAVSLMIFVLSSRLINVENKNEYKS